MDYIKAFLIAIAGGAASLVLSFLVKILVDNPKKRSDQEEAEINAILCLLRSDIVWRCRSLLTQKISSLEDKAIISQEFDVYKKMGGNGFVDGLVHKAEDLPEVPYLTAKKERQNEDEK